MKGVYFFDVFSDINENSARNPKKVDLNKKIYINII